ncbi:MAG: hypothetical protein AAF267_11190 [Deinococcota bacterium]
MGKTSFQKVTVSLPEDVFQLANSYRENHNMDLNDVFVLALRTLRQRELAEGYKALASEQNNTLDGALVDSGLTEVLESTEW